MLRMKWEQDGRIKARSLNDNRITHRARNPDASALLGPVKQHSFQAAARGAEVQGKVQGREAKATEKPKYNNLKKWGEVTQGGKCQGEEMYNIVTNVTSYQLLVLCVLSQHCPQT